MVSSTDSLPPSFQPEIHVMAHAPIPTFQKYEIEGILGQGSMGTVYKAQHKMLGRAVALKIPHRETIRSDMAKKRFLREGRALAMLQHPYIVGVYDADEENNIPYLAMEYVEGPTLSEYIRKNKSLPFSEVKRITIQIAEALEYIHQKGILHRDLKSSNVLITHDGQARITDFGIAQVETQATITNGIVGTPAYMSPEQAKGAHIDGRSDIYSLGVVMYEALTGHIPFIAENGLAVLQKIIHDAPAPLQNYRPDISAPLSNVVLRCLEKNPSDRYASGNQLAQAIRTEQKKTRTHPSVQFNVNALFEYTRQGIRLLTSRLPTFAPSLTHRLKSLLNDRPTLIALAFVTFLTLGVFLIVFSIGWRTETVRSEENNPLTSDSTHIDVDSSKTGWTPWPSN